MKTLSGRSTGVRNTPLVSVETRAMSRHAAARFSVRTATEDDDLRSSPGAWLEPLPRTERRGVARQQGETTRQPSAPLIAVHQIESGRRAARKAKRAK